MVIYWTYAEIHACKCALNKMWNYDKSQVCEITSSKVLSIIKSLIFPQSKHSHYLITPIKLVLSVYLAAHKKYVNFRTSVHKQHIISLKLTNIYHIAGKFDGGLVVGDAHVKLNPVIINTD